MIEAVIEMYLLGCFELLVFEWINAEKYMFELLIILIIEQ